MWIHIKILSNFGWQSSQFLVKHWHPLKGFKLWPLYYYNSNYIVFSYLNSKPCSTFNRLFEFCQSSIDSDLKSTRTRNDTSYREEEIIGRVMLTILRFGKTFQRTLQTQNRILHSVLLFWFWKSKLTKIWVVNLWPRILKVSHYCQADIDMTFWTTYISYFSPSSIAFFTALKPSWTASFICVKVCLFGPGK